MDAHELERVQTVAENPPGSETARFTMSGESLGVTSLPEHAGAVVRGTM
jgi:hypothetical protein